MLVLFRSPAQLRAAGMIICLPRPSRPLYQFSSSTTRLASSISSSAPNGRCYQHAMSLLESLQSNRAVVNSISSSSRDMNQDAIPEMIDWMRKAGYNVDDLHKHGLKCIHVAGTKGKGSVCAMTENILMQYRREGSSNGQPVLAKIGLYTSPHLLDVCERIRIDGVPISKDLFARYFFELWDRFSNAAAATSESNGGVTTTDKPGFFRFLTILAFHTFIKEGVETAIIECGIGGEYDSTNIMPPRAVTAIAITSLGIDHVGLLGDTIEQIAWHKSGIMKHGIPAYTVPQVTEAQNILHERAAEKGAELNVVRRLQLLETENIVLGLGGNFQVDNGSLAIAIASSHLRSIGITKGIPEPTDLTKAQLPKNFVRGLQTVVWPGRCQIIRDGNIEWLLDGAHTKESIIVAADWFAENYMSAIEASSRPTHLMLIFNQQDRNAEDLLKTLMHRLQTRVRPDAFLEMDNTGKSRAPVFGSFPSPVFRYAAFCTNISQRNPDKKQQEDLHLQKKLAALYTKLDSNSSNETYETIQEAVMLARRVSLNKNEKIMVLVTGSLYLVGGVLKVLAVERAEDEEDC